MSGLQIKIDEKFNKEIVEPASSKVAPKKDSIAQVKEVTTHLSETQLQTIAPSKRLRDY